MDKKTERTRHTNCLPNSHIENNINCILPHYTLCSLAGNYRRDKLSASSALKMKAAGSFKIVATTYRATWCHNPNQIQHFQHCGTSSLLKIWKNHQHIMNTAYRTVSERSHEVSVHLQHNTLRRSCVCYIHL